MAAKLYGIGVGPGAADLITLRAINALKKCNILLCARRLGNDESLAYQIAKEYVPKDCRIEALDFPMTREKDVLQKAWENAATKTLSYLDQDLTCAFVTLGDPLLYSTFGYLLKTVRAISPETPVCVIPAISSFQAALARVGLPLCEEKENVHIISGINSQEVLEQEIGSSDTCVILKAYRNFPAIYAALKKLGRLETSIQASFVEQENEVIHCPGENERPPYLTLIVSKKNVSHEKDLA